MPYTQKEKDEFYGGLEREEKDKIWLQGYTTGWIITLIIGILTLIALH